MDPRIEKLQSTTFFEKRLMRSQISNIQKTVRQFPSLSLRELGHTVCEYLARRPLKMMRGKAPTKSDGKAYFCMPGGSDEEGNESYRQGGEQLRKTFINTTAVRPVCKKYF